MIETYDEVINYLKENNYNEFNDYWYPYRVVYLDGSSSYNDLYGNEYKGENYNIKLKLQNGGKVFIGSNCKIDNVEINAFNMSKIKIGDEFEVALRACSISSDYFSNIILIPKNQIDKIHSLPVILLMVSAVRL